MIKKIPIEPTYKKDNGLWNLNTLLLPLPDNFTIAERNIIYIPGGQFGGNHKHPRTEVFIGIGDLYLIWQDAAGDNHEDKMKDDEQLYLFFVESFTPHTVVNRGTNPAVLFELADGPNVNVEPAILL
jgi:hypothetical protein